MPPPRPPPTTWRAGWRRSKEACGLAPFERGVRAGGRGHHDSAQTLGARDNAQTLELGHSHLTKGMQTANLARPRKLIADN